MAETGSNGEFAALAPEALARALFEQSPFSCVIYDREGRPLAVNAAFTRLMGITLADAHPDYTVLRDPQLEATGVIPLIERAFAGESITLPPVRYDARVHAEGGHTSWTQAHLYPIRADNGEVVQVVLVHHDLTARMEVEAALRDSEAELSDARVRLEAILNAVRDGITVQDEHSNIVYANAAAARISGFDDVNAYIHTPIAELLSRFTMRDEAGNPFPLDRLPSRRALQGETDPDALINYVVHATGEEHWTLMRSRLIPLEPGRRKLVVNAMHDITERMRHQRAMQENAAALQLVADAGRVFASSMDSETTLR